MAVKGKHRLHRLDALRGGCLISMIAYHGLWNLCYLFGVPMDWYQGRIGYLWQQSICWVFLLLAGFCWSMSRSHWKRGTLILGGGVLVSLVTHLLVPAGRITFGILTCTGSCVLLLIPLEKYLSQIPEEWGAAISFALFLLLRNCAGGSLGFETLSLAELPQWLYRDLLTTYLGFPMKGFYSADYFPLIPWAFLFLSGYFLYRLLHGRGLDEKLFAKGELPVLNWMGRRSLLIYLLHQPVLYGICLAVNCLIK